MWDSTNGVRACLWKLQAEPSILIPNHTCTHQTLNFITQILEPCCHRGFYFMRKQHKNREKITLMLTLLPTIARARFENKKEREIGFVTSFRATFGLTRSIGGWEEGERRERRKWKRQPGRTGAGQRREWQLNEQREEISIDVGGREVDFLFTFWEWERARARAGIQPTVAAPSQPDYDRIQNHRTSS